jgi:alpha-ketoglutarate-dependent taurine dioxygenase
VLLCSPVVRTNPVTGWKSLFGAGHQVHAGWYNGVTERESDVLKEYCELHSLHPQDILKTGSDFRAPSVNQIIFENHDLQVRFRWNQNDLAIWDK